MTTEYHEIDITLEDDVTVKTIKAILTYGGIPSDISLDLDDEIYISMIFENLDEFLTFWGVFAKYIRTVWDNSEIGPKFHNYV